jgi:hypothetical protein
MKQATKPQNRVQCDIMIACNHGLIKTLVRKIKAKSKEWGPKTWDQGIKVSITTSESLWSWLS